MQKIIKDYQEVFIAQVAICFINNRVTPQGCAPGKLEPFAGKLAWAVLREQAGGNGACYTIFEIGR